MAETRTVRDQLASIVRTAVPIGVGFVLSLLAREWGVVLDDASSQALASGVTALASAAYYVLVRALESRWSGFGWLLGLALPPTYVKGEVISVEDSPYNRDTGTTIQ